MAIDEWRAQIEIESTNGYSEKDEGDEDNIVCNVLVHFCSMHQLNLQSIKDKGRKILSMQFESCGGNGKALCRGCLHHGPWSCPLLLLKYVIGRWTCPRTMELDIPTRFIFSVTLSNVMVQHVLHWERQRRLSCCKHQRTMAKKCFFLYSFVKHSHNYNRRRRREGQTRRKLPKLSILDKYIEKHFRFLVHGHFSWSMFILHLLMGPKALIFFLWSDHEKGTMKCDYRKMAFNMGQLHGPWC